MSISTMITVCDTEEEMTGRSIELDRLTKETQLFDVNEEPETVEDNSSNSMTRNSPLLREIATETGMENWFRIKSETPFYASNYKEKYGGHLTKSPDVAKTSGSQPLINHSRPYIGATVDHLKLEDFKLRSKSDIIVKTNPISGATIGSVEEINIGPNSSDPSSSKTESKGYTVRSGNQPSPYNHSRKPKGNSTPNSSVKSSPSAVKESVKTKQSLAGSPLAKAATPKAKPNQSLTVSPLVKGAKPSSNASPLIRKKNKLHPKSTSAVKNSPRLTPVAIRQKAETNVNSLKDILPPIEVEEQVENELSFI